MLCFCVTGMCNPTSDVSVAAEMSCCIFVWFACGIKGGGTIAHITTFWTKLIFFSVFVFIIQAQALGLLFQCYLYPPPPPPYDSRATLQLLFLPSLPHCSSPHPVPKQPLPPPHTHTQPLSHVLNVKLNAELVSKKLLQN